MILWVLAVTMAAAGIVTVVYTILEVYRLHVTLPFGDEWLMTFDVERIRDGTYTISSLANQYNEHRILIPRLFFFIDTFVFGGSERFDIAVTFLFQAVNAAVLIASMWKQTASPRARWFFTGFVLLVLFSLRQADNFTIGFQLQFTGVFAFANLAFLPFLSGLRRLRGTTTGRRAGIWPRLVAAYALCAASTYTMANGALAAPTLFVLGVLLRAPGRVLLATAAVSAALAALYFHGLRPMGLGLSFDASLADPLAYPRFLAAMLGNVLGLDVRYPALVDPFLAPVAFGLAGLVGMAAAAWMIVRSRDLPPASPVLLGVMGFAVASALATTYGRVGVGIAQAFEQRYMQIGALFWGAMVLFWAPFIGRLRRRGLRVVGRVGLAATVVVLVAALGIAEIRAPHEMIVQTAQHRTFRDAVLSGFLDPRAGRYEIWAPADLARPVAILRAGRLSLFAGPEADERGRPVEALGEVAPPSACAGSVSAEADPALGPDGVRLVGTAWDVDRDRPVSRILTVAPDGRVSGFGSLDRPVGRIRAWTAYATAPAGSMVSAYAMMSNGSMCELGAAKAVAP